MTIGGYIVAGPGEGDRYLPQVLERTLPLVDWMVICGNGIDEKTEKVCDDPKITLVKRAKNDWAEQQWAIKQWFFEQYIAPRNPDWIVCLDADEILDPNLTREGLEEMSQRGEVAYEFLCMQRWDGKVRVDGAWGGFFNVRYFKFIDDVPHTWPRQNLHCGLAPEYAYHWRAPCEYYFLHYGYDKASDRKKKIERYQKYDTHEAWFLRDYYHRMRHPELGEYYKLEELKRPRYQPKRPSLDKVIRYENRMNKKEPGVVVRNSKGKVYTVPKSLAEQGSKRTGPGHLEIIQDMEEVDELLAISEEPPKESHVCSCGKELGSERSLTMHKRRTKHE